MSIMIVSQRTTDLLCYAAAMILGLVSVIIPPILQGAEQYNHPLFPSIRTGIEGLSWITLAFLALSGMALGVLNPRRAWRWGLSTMIAFPILVLIDLIFSLASHQLLPLEMLMYVLLTVPGILGAQLGALLRPLFRAYLGKT